MKKGICIGVLLLMVVFRLHAQVDPVLTGMILTYTEKAEKQLKSQSVAMGLQTTGHVWVASEVEKTTEVQKVYNDYLDSFRDIVCYAAQSYGFYVEVNKLVGTMSEMNRILKLHPSGTFAVALSTRRNAIYRNLIINSVEIVNDIRKVCLSEIKMTEKQRIEIVFNIRPKLANMSNQLRRLTKAVKYTTFGNIWEKIEQSQRENLDKVTICRDCMGRWKRKAKLGF